MSLTPFSTAHSVRDQRIERIEILLGHTVADASLHGALLMATAAHDLQTTFLQRAN